MRRAVLQHLPEGVFGHNWLQLVHEETGAQLRFDVGGALMQWVLLSVEHGSGGLKVPAASVGGWAERWPTMFQTQEYDWTYGTDYCGDATAPRQKRLAQGAATRQTRPWRTARLAALWLGTWRGHTCAARDSASHQHACMAARRGEAPMAVCKGGHVQWGHMLCKGGVCKGGCDRMWQRLQPTGALAGASRYITVTLPLEA